MNVEIGTEAPIFPEKEYINGIAVAVMAQLDVLHGGGVHTHVAVRHVHLVGVTSLSPPPTRRAVLDLVGQFLNSKMQLKPLKRS